ncbi:LLM class flavin-dependent oxidoreductase [Variovorax sp. H27-G14]|uniref:LLM class flavin-dependent oxidoreductase n=1 Tax=Variovorax sp. H27-G14 TaxID=3111914 RepID=UPI0038FBF7E8
MNTPLRIDLAGYSREATLGDHRAFLAFFAQAERLGFDGVWFHEFRLLQGGGPYPSPMLLAAALLARTERLRVGISALVLPLHHPLLLAEEIAQLDVQSEGRIDIGIGRGTDPSTLRALQIDPATTRERFERACLLLRDALSGKAVSSNDGPWRFDAQTVGPACVQRPHPPLYIAGSTAQTMGFAVAHGFPLLLSLEPPETAQLGHVAAAFAESDIQGQARMLAGSSLSRHVCIGATQAEALAQAERLLPLLHARRLHFARLRGVAPDQLPVLDVARVLREQVVMGDPQACVAQIGQLVARTGVRQLRCVFNGNGALAREEALVGMRLFAQEAMPALRQGV